MWWKNLFSICFCLLLSFDSCRAQPHSGNDDVLPELHPQFLIDTLNCLTPDSMALRSVQKNFTSRNLLSEKFPTWVKVPISQSLIPGDYCLDTGLEETVQAFVIRRNEIVQQQNGRFLSPALRSVPSNFRYLCFDLEPADSVIYLRVAAVYSRPVVIDLTIKEKSSTLKTVAKNRNGTFLITGAACIIVLCGFTLFLILHDFSYLWFSLYVVCSYVMSNTVFLGYVFGDEFPMLFLNDYTVQIYFILCPLSLLGFCLSFFRIRKHSPVWYRVFLGLIFSSVICFATIPADAVMNSLIILFYNIVSVVLVAVYSAISFFRNKYLPGGYFLLAFLTPILMACVIVLDYFRIFPVRSLNLFAGFGYLTQSIILFIGVAMRYQKINEELMRVTFSKWQKEHEAKVFQLKNTELLSQNEIIEKQKNQLAAQARSLEETNGTKDKLLSVLSHDLRAPVGNLRSILALLSERRMSADEFHNLSEKLKTDVEDVYGMLEDVLHWVKSQHGGIVAHPVDFNLKLLTDEVVHLALPGASEKKIGIAVDCPGDPNVHADPDQVHIILRNLISNAIKFAVAGSSVTVALKPDQKFVTVSIHDQGIGIRQDDVEKIMMGKKIMGTRGTGGEKGTGLGLLLCREFIQLNGGQFFLNSTYGKGTTVSFTLPVQKS
jgi:signal transduction histidine kinase